MPTYDYVCEACGHEFEFFQSMSDRRLTQCPVCKKSRLVRKVGAGGGVIFKGSGFYQTDYKAKPRPAESARESSETSSSSENAATSKEPASKEAASSATDGKAAKAPAPAASDGGEKPARATRGAKGSKK